MQSICSELSPSSQYFPSELGTGFVQVLVRIRWFPVQIPAAHPLHADQPDQPPSTFTATKQCGKQNKNIRATFEFFSSSFRVKVFIFSITCKKILSMERKIRKNATTYNTPKIAKTMCKSLLSLEFLIRLKNNNFIQLAVRIRFFFERLQPEEQPS